ncbi:MAG TPA: hypothetical protein VK168_10280 [Saprospiraceae bacterium]|nr:hypothetical protein [Saprospiraceae bacterium]
MLNRKLLEVLKLFKPQEHAQFRQFLLSPYFNNRSNAAELIRLYDLIMTAGAEEEHPELDKAKVAALFFPGKPFNANQKGPLDTLASDLFGMVKLFLTQKSYEKNNTDFDEGLALARFYRGFGMEERFWQIISALRKDLSQQVIQDASFFRQQFLLEEEAATFQSLYNSFEDDANISVAVKYLDIAFILEKIELLCSLKYQQKLAQPIDFDFDSPLTQVILNYPAEYPKIPLYDLYLIAWQLIPDPLKDEYFAGYEAYLDQFEKNLPFDKARNLKAFYRYFWTQRYSKLGGSEVRTKVFEVYKSHFEDGYFYENGQIIINALKALILFGLRLKQFDWVKKVLDEHPPTRICGTKYPVEAHSLCMAEYHFYTRDFETALNTLVYKHFENPNYSLWAEMLLIKIYFETSDELVEYRMKALDQKVRRTKLSAESKARYYKFLQKLDKIIKYGLEKKSQKREKLIEEIKNTPGINERDWLLEKLGAGG